MRAKRSVINSVAAALIIMILYFIVHYGFSLSSVQQVMLHAANACSIAGVLLILAAGIGWLQKNHMMDWLGYALYQARFLLLKYKDQSFANFYDYRAAKEKDYQKLLLWPRFWVGAFFLALGVMFSWMFVQQGV